MFDTLVNKKIQCRVLKKKRNKIEDGIRNVKIKKCFLLEVSESS